MSISAEHKAAKQKMINSKEDKLFNNLHTNSKTKQKMDDFIEGPKQKLTEWQVQKQH